MPDFIWKWRREIIFSALIVLAMGMLVSRHEPGLIQRALRHGVSFIIVPFQKTATTLVSQGRDFVSLVFSLNRLRRTNAVLQGRVEMLLLENAALKAQALENQQLRTELGYQQSVAFQFIPALIVSRDPASWLERVVTDLGSASGIQPGAGVITPQGVAGRVMDVSIASTTIMLLPDPQSSVSGLVERSRVAGTIVGTGQALLKLRHVSNEDDVQPGDVIVTSTLSSLFPPGLPIGNVVSVKPSENGLMLDIDVKPRVDFRILDRLLLLRAGKNE